MIRPVICLLLLLYMSWSVRAQDMSDGFSMLSRGDFKEAEAFFNEILRRHPANKTARVCFGRATGLSGNTIKALTIFDHLLADYPGDQEVLLNKAEAYLWRKDADRATDIYYEILKADSTNFTALLGIANSFSMDQSYEKAWEYIQKALGIQPKNNQAKISGKYIRLGYANQLASEKQQFEKALGLVGQNLDEDPDDQESLSLLANIYLMSEDYVRSDSTYSLLRDSIQSLKGKSKALHLLGRNREALQKAAEVRRLARDTGEVVQSNIVFVRALLWNNKIREARIMIDSMIAVYPDQVELLAGEAEVSMYEADFEKGYHSFSSYLEHLPESFTGNLGKADASHALGLDHQAYNYAYRTLMYYPGQKDAINFISKLNFLHSPRMHSGYSVGRASDGSSNYSLTIGGSLSLSPLLSTKAIYRQKNFEGAHIEGIRSETMTISVTGQTNKRLKLSGSYSLINLYLGEGGSTQRSDVDISLNAKVNKIQQLEAGYQTEIQDFNGQLLRQNIKTVHYMVKNLMYWKVSGFGWYSEIYHSNLSDDNKRNLIFTSLYKDITQKPALKAGFNFLMMSFEKNRPADYFSPLRYNQKEVFAAFDLANNKFIGLSGEIAAGIQEADNQNPFSWRAKLNLKKELGNFSFSATGSYSTISATQSAGFSFLELKGQLSWRINDTPIFDRKFRLN